LAERPLNVAWSCMPSPARRECRHPRHGPFPQWTEPASRDRCPFFRWLPQLCKPLVDARHPAPSPSTSRGQFQAAASSSSSSRSRRARRRGAYAGVVTNLAQVE